MRRGWRTTILSLLACEIPKIRGLKVFVTARPERHIRNKLDQYHDLKQFHMQDIERSIVEADIQHYLESRLSAQAVQRAFPELGPSPRHLTTERMKILVGMSGMLFIIARTASDFILDPTHVDLANRIATVIDGVSPTGSKHATIMGNIYLWIIRAAQPQPAEIWVHWFRNWSVQSCSCRIPFHVNHWRDYLGSMLTRSRGYYRISTPFTRH